MSGHTPGPWKWERVADAGCIVEWTLKGPDVLCRYWYDKPPSSDASLIAAAPNLLSICKTALNAFEKNWAIDWEELRTAIAKAEGQEDTVAAVGEVVKDDTLISEK